MPLGFTFWGHIFNGSAAALGLFLTFKLYDYGKKKRVLYLRILPFLIYVAIGALIPYINDAQHLEKHGMGSTIPVYIVANDLYVFLFGLLELIEIIRKMICRSYHAYKGRFFTAPEERYRITSTVLPFC